MEQSLRQTQQPFEKEAYDLEVNSATNEMERFIYNLRHGVMEIESAWYAVLNAPDPEDIKYLFYDICNNLEPIQEAIETAKQQLKKSYGWKEYQPGSS